MDSNTSNLLDAIEEIKEKLSSEEYKRIMELLKKTNKSQIWKLTLFYPVVNIDYYEKSTNVVRASIDSVVLQISESSMAPEMIEMLNKLNGKTGLVDYHDGTIGEDLSNWLEASWVTLIEKIIKDDETISHSHIKDYEFLVEQVAITVEKC